MDRFERVQKLRLLTPKGFRPPSPSSVTQGPSTRSILGPTPIRKTAGRKRKGRKSRKTRKATRRR